MNNLVLASLNFDWSSLILASGIINGLLSLFLLHSRFTGRTAIFFWLVSVVLCIQLILIERIIRFSGLIDTYPIILFISSPVFFFLLPLLYCYQRKLMGHRTLWFLHFIIPALFLLILIPSITQNAQEKLTMFNTPGITDPPWIVVVYFLYSISYSVAIYFLNRNHKKTLIDNFTDPDIHKQLFSNKVILVCGFLTLALPLELTIQFFSWNPEIKILLTKWMFILFSFSLHMILIFQSFISEFRYLKIEKDKSTERIPEVTQEMTDLQGVLTKYVEKNQPYLNNDLTLQELANQIGWGRSKLSQIINTGFQKNFYTYINEYRIQEICKLLKAGAHKKFSLDYLAKDNGFKSYASFFRTFKKLKKQTPKEYLKTIKDP